jgi:hypothetical protein
MQLYGVGAGAGAAGAADAATPPHFSAYRFHDSELLVHHDNLSLVWRCGDGNSLGDGPVLYDPGEHIDVFSQVLAYNW